MLDDGTLTYVGSDSILTGTNTHKSELDITKTVVDDSDNKIADPDQLFTYDVTVTDGKAADGKVAFSILDANGDVVTEDGRVTGATATNGIYSATSAAALTIKIKAGEKIAFTNLGTGSTYSVTEETPAYGYVNTAITNSDGGTATVPTATGTIEQGNTTYAVGYTNTFDSVTLSGDTALKVIKAVTGHDATEAFGFSLTPDADTQAAIAAGKVKVADGALTATSSDGIKKGTTEDVNFGDITFYTEGTYTFTADETTTTTAGGWAYDTATHDITVTVSKDATTGKLVANVKGNGPTFTNAYTAQPVTDVTIPVRKSLSVSAGLTAPDITSKYTFTLAAKTTGAPMPEATTVTNPDADGGTASFGGITYTTAGTYTYTVTEAGDVSGVSNDSAAASGKTVTVTVTDNNAGQLVASVSSTQDSPLTFTNTYSVGEAKAVISVEKLLVVQNGDNAPDVTGKYTFTLVTTNGAPMPGTTTVKSGASGATVDFPEITYSTPGTYTYTVTESGSLDGVTNDGTATKTVSVVVSDNSDGTMSATVNGGNGAVIFTNTYNAASVDVTIPVQKTLGVLSGNNAPSVENQYTFTLKDANDDVVGTVKSGASGAIVNFPAITYTAPGTYTYTITEAGTLSGVTNDAAASTGKTVTVHVTDNGAGQLAAAINGSGAADDVTNFTNTYRVASTTVAIPVEKVLSVPAGLTGPGDITGKFKFTLAPVGNTPMPAANVITSGASGATVSFGSITYTTPGDYSYKITESGIVSGVTNDAAAASGKTVTIHVTDNGEGKLVATINGDSADDDATVFTNTYGITTPATATIPVEKSLTVPAGLTGPASVAGKFTFTLTAATEGAPMPATGGDVVTNPDADGGTASFGAIEFTAPGTYVYTVTETGSADGVTNDTTAAKDVTVTVTDNGDGTLSASSTSTADDPLTFTNTYGSTPASFTLGVTKTLDVKSGNNAPDISNDFTFTLAAVTTGAPMPAAGGEVVTNPDGNGTKVNFGAISFTAPGDYRYTITESGSVDGVANDAQATRAITIHVSDNGDGSLTPSVTVGSQVSSFTNSYSVTPVTLKDGIKLTKALTGANLAAGEFEFTLAAADGTPMPVNTKVTNGSDGSVAFGDITYTAPGTYEYVVTEDNTGKAGYTYDDSTIDVMVVVTDNGDGTMTAATRYGEQKTFSNSYAASGSVTLTAMKTLDGRELKDGQFSFELKDANGTVLQTVKNDAAGSVTFAPIDYTNESIATTTPNEVTKVAVSATVGGTEGAPVSVQLYANDVASGDPVTGVTTANYDFGEQAKCDADGNVITYSVSVNGADKVAATTTDVDPGSTTTYGKKDFAYTISEVNDGKDGYTYDDKVVNVTVTVTDAGNGKITAVPTYEPSAKFENSYHATGSTGEGDLGGTKVSNGVVAEGQFSFELKDEQGKVLQTVKNAADGSFSFEPLSYDETQVGTHTYSIVEVNDGQVGYTYDTHVATATVNVTDNGDGTLAVTTSYGETSREFDNPYKALGTSTQLQAKKVLVGRDLAAGEFDFQLTDQSGKTYTAKNAADGTITFPYVSFDEPGTYTFTASEVAGGEANVTYDGSIFTYTVVVEDVRGQLAVTSATVNGSDDAPTFTNTYVEPVVKVPDTGDASGVGVLAALVAGAAAVAAGAVARRRDQE